MMSFLDLAIARFILFLLLLTFSSNVLASDAQISDSIEYRSRRSPPISKAQVLVERKLDAVAPDSAVPGITAPVPSPSSRPPPPPSNRRPALITPGSDSPGADLPPKVLPAPPPPGSHSITPPASMSSKQSKVAVILGLTLGVLVFLLATLSAAAYFKPDWLPCCRGRSSHQYERHLPT